MRKTLLAFTIAAAAVVGIVLPTAGTATSADRHCYTLGVPGQNHYEYCTYLPVDPGDLIR